MPTEYETVDERSGQSKPQLVIVQHSSRFAPQEAYGNLRRYREIKQGDNSLSFYER